MNGISCSIRSASEADIPAITGIYNQAVAEQSATCDLSDVAESQRGRWMRRHRYPYGIWVAEDAASVKGWVAVSPYDPKPCFHGTATFSTYVDKASRGQGVGTLLRSHMIAEARSRGFHALVNRVWANNVASIEFAKRFGFRQVGHFPELVELDGRYIDCLFFELLL